MTFLLVLPVQVRPHSVDLYLHFTYHLIPYICVLTNDNSVGVNCPIQPNFLVFTAQDGINPIFGNYLMEPGADYAQPLEGGTGQIFGTPLSQSQRSVCYNQRTYEDTAVEGDEYFSLRVATEARTLSNVVINEALNTTLVRIIDDDMGEISISWL